MAVSYKHEPYEPAIALLNIYPSEIKTYIHTHTKQHKNIPSSLIRSIQKQKTIQMSTTREIMVYLHNGILISTQKESATDTCNNHESQKHDVTGNKPYTQE